jgi:uncharacterized protein YciI
MPADRETAGIFFGRGIRSPAIVDRSAEPAASRHEEAMKPVPQFVVFHVPGPRWQRGVVAFEQEGLQAHVDHYRALLQSGKMVLGGPFLDETGGGMMVAAPGVSGDELATFAASDPAIASGLLTFEVRPWLIGMRAADRP